MKGVRLAAVAPALLALACASAPPPLPPSRWVPPPRSASCSDATPCENVKRWFAIEKEAAEAWSACHPVPLRGSEQACARADASFAAVHREQLDYVDGLCTRSVGSDAWTVLPYLGTPESDRIASCGGRGGSGTFTCRVLEWTWATSTRGAAFVLFLVEPRDAPPGVWAVNSCSYCETGGACREFPVKP